MNIREYKKELENKNWDMACLVEKICNHYGVDDEEEMNSYSVQSGAYLNGRWLSLSDIFDLIDEIS